MKKILTAIAALGIILSFTTCETLNAILEEPRVSLYSVEVKGIDFTGVELLCRIQVENQNAVSVSLPEVGWEIFLNNNRFTSGVIRNNQRVTAMASTIVDATVRLNHVDIFRSFQSLLGNRQTAYRIALTPKVTLPVLGDKTWRFEHSGNLPLLQLPTLSAPSLRVDSIDLTRAEILVTANISNPNAFPLPSVKLAYDYQLNRASFLKGTAETERISASSTMPVAIRLPVVYTDIIRNIQNLGSSSNIPSLFILTVDFGIPGLESRNIEIPGTFNLPLRF